MIDSGIPASTALHTVERVRMMNNGQTLEIEYTLSDAKSWEGEWKMTKRWNRQDDRDIAEVSCLPDLNDHMPSTRSQDNVRSIARRRRSWPGPSRNSTNPHSWIDLDVTNDKGVTQTWSVEMTSPAFLIRAGWKSSTLKAGDKVSITLRPFRNGAGGLFVSVTLPDGRVLGERATPPPAQP